MQHFWLNIHGQYAPFGTDQLGQLECVKTVAAAHVANDLPWLNVQRLEQQGTVLFTLSRIAGQPRRSEIVHRDRDLAALVFLFGRWNLRLTSRAFLGSCRFVGNGLVSPVRQPPRESQRQAHPGPPISTTFHRMFPRESLDLLETPACHAIKRYDTHSLRGMPQPRAGAWGGLLFFGTIDPATIGD
jgi:hypothetical protein